jgi:hypothetical protein
VSWSTTSIPGWIGAALIVDVSGSGVADEDAALMKNFVIKEKKYVQVRLEAYRVTNSPHWRLDLWADYKCDG